MRSLHNIIIIIKHANCVCLPLMRLFDTLSCEPRHEKTCFMPYANNKGAARHAHPRSLTSTFIVHSLDSIVPVVAMYEISRFQLASVAAEAGLSLTWSKTPKTHFLVTRRNCDRK